MRHERRTITNFSLSVALVAALSGCAAAGAESNIGVTVGDAPNLDVLTLPGEGDAAAKSERIAAAVERLPEIVNGVLDQTGVPGMSVAVVSDGEIVFADGFGVREIGTDLAVDPDTVFQIASVSKPLSATAIAAAIAQSDGKLSWETPIHDLLPSFAFSDDVVTERATIGDAFSHRTGIPTGAGDDLEDLGYKRDEILNRLRLVPLDSFRTSYHYSNFGITLGAEAVAASRDQSWEEMMDELVFDPIGMESSSARHDDYLAHDDRALLHAKIDNEFVAAFDRDPDPQSPAGGVSSTVNDLARWMMVLLDGGVLTVDGEETELADPDALLAAMSPQIISTHSMRADQRPGHYGYGFNASPLVGGRMAVSHSGAFVMGAGTNFQIVPDLGLGIVALSNGAPVGAPEAVTAQFLDVVQFGEPTRDWANDMSGAFAGLLLPVGDLVSEDRPVSATEPTNLGELTGTYKNPYFGEMRIEQSGEGMTMNLGPKQGMEIELNPWDGDVFIYALETENLPTGSRASGTFDRAGNKVTLTLETFDENGLGTWTKTE